MKFRSEKLTALLYNSLIQSHSAIITFVQQEQEISTKPHLNNEKNKILYIIIFTSGIEIYDIPKF